MLLMIMAVYIALQIAISAYVARGTSSDEDYLVAGRKLGVFPIAMSLFATWFASETVIATSAEVAASGMAGARSEPFAYGLGMLVIGMFMARRLRAGGHFTLAGFIGARFGPRTEALSAVPLVLSSVVWAGAQLYAMALIISTSGSIDFMLALTMATLTVLTYTLLGGLLGDVATDVIQGMVLTMGVLFLLAMVIVAAGGIGPAFASVRAEQLHFVVPGESLFNRAEIWLIPVIGTICSQEMVSRVLGARDEHVARRGAIYGALLYTLIGSVPILIGLFGINLGLDLGEGDAFLPDLARLMMPGWLYVVFVAAMVSAILSSVDSALLAVSAVATESGYRRIRPYMGARESLIVARTCTVGACLLAFAVAASGSGLRDMVMAASAITGVVAVPIVGALITKAGGPLAGLVSLLVTILVYVLLEWVIQLPGAILVALLAGVFGFGLGVILEQRAGRIPTVI